MGFPDPTVDPITGLPILDISPIVQQIPLGRQTVDYAGWNATAQPTRTPLYPDDVIPVFANVQGQHPQTGNAQNVGTDGHGRLLVKDDTGGGGGGLTFKAYTPQDASDDENSTVTNKVLGSITVADQPYVYGFTIDCFFWWKDTAIGVIHDDFVVVLYAPTTASARTLARIGILLNRTTASPYSESHHDIMFPAPMDLAAMFPGQAAVTIAFSSPGYLGQYGISLCVYA
jgi:hypothetical protein